MSLALRGEVAAVAQRQWVGRIWYLKEAPDNLLRDVSQMLNAMVAGSALDATEENVPILYAQKIAANVMTTAANRYSVWFCAATSP